MEANGMINILDKKTKFSTSEFDHESVNAAQKMNINWSKRINGIQTFCHVARKQKMQ